MARAKGITHIIIECVDNADVFPGVIVYDDKTFPIPPQQISIECVDNADGFPGVIVYDDKTFPIPSQQISIECVDNADGFPGVIVYNDKTFPIPSQQGVDFGAAHGPHSSLRTFQFHPFWLDEETDGCGPPDLK